jgi:hypothetical protein
VTNSEGHMKVHSQAGRMFDIKRTHTP